MSNETSQAETQRAAHYGRILDRSERIAALESLLTEDDKLTVLIALQDAGYIRTGESGNQAEFDDKSLPEIRAAIQDLIAHFKAENAEVPGLTQAIKNRLVDVKPAEPAATEATELSPERTATLAALKANHDRLATFANGVTWADAEKALRASPADLDNLAKLLTLRPNSDLTVTGRENGEIMFEEIAPNCPGVKNITYDKDAQTLAESRGEKCNGNAIDLAASFGAKPIQPSRYKALRGKVKGLDESTWAWVLTDEATRKSGLALHGDLGNVYKNDANFHHTFGGVRCALGVKEA